MAQLTTKTKSIGSWQPAGDPLSGEVMTLAGPVEAVGSLSLSDRDYRVDIVVGSEQALDNQLQQALSLVATPEDERYRLTLEGRL